MTDVNFIASETNRLKEQVFLINTDMNTLLLNVQHLSKRCDEEQNPETKHNMMLELEQSMNILQSLKEASTKIMAKLDSFVECDLSQLMEEKDSAEGKINKALEIEKKVESVEHIEKDNLPVEEDENIEDMEMDLEEIKMLREIKQMEAEKKMLEQTLLLKRQERQTAALKVKQQKERDAINLITELEKRKVEQEIANEKFEDDFESEEAPKEEAKKEDQNQVESNQQEGAYEVDEKDMTEEEKVEMAKQYELIMKLLEIKTMQEQKLKIEEEMLRQEVELKTIEAEEQRLKDHLSTQKVELGSKEKQKDDLEHEIFGNTLNQDITNEDMKKMLLIEEMKLLQEMMSKKDKLEAELQSLEKDAEVLNDRDPEDFVDDDTEEDVNGDIPEEIEFDADEIQEKQARDEASKVQRNSIPAIAEPNAEFNEEAEMKLHQAHLKQNEDMLSLKHEEKRLQELIAAKEEEQKKIELELLVKEQEEMLLQLEAMKAEKEKQLLEQRETETAHVDAMEKKVTEKNPEVEFDAQDDDEILKLLNSTSDTEMTPEMMEEKIKILELIEQKQEMERMLLEAEQEKMYNEMEMFKRMTQLKGEEMMEVENLIAQEKATNTELKGKVGKEDVVDAITNKVKREEQQAAKDAAKVPSKPEVQVESQNQEADEIEDDEHLRDMDALAKLKAIENLTDEQMNDPEIQARILNTLQEFESRKSQLEELIKMQEMQLEMQKELEMKEQMLTQTIKMQEESLSKMKDGPQDDHSVHVQDEGEQHAQVTPIQDEVKVVPTKEQTQGEVEQVGQELDEQQQQTLDEIHRLEFELKEKLLQQQKEEALTKELEQLLKLEESAIMELTLKQQALEKEYLTEELKIKESMIELNKKAIKPEVKGPEVDAELKKLRDEVGTDDDITDQEKAEIVAKIEEQLSKKLKEID